MFCTTHEAWKNGFRFVHSYGLTSRYKKGRASSHEEARRVQVIYKIRFNFLITGHYLRPKSAGISPHLAVSHFMMGVRTLCVRSHCSARAMIWFRFFVTLQFGFTLTISYPQNGIVRIRVDGFIVYSLFLHKSKSVHNSQKLAYIVGSMQRPEMKNLCPCRQIDSLILHRTRVPAASSVNSPRACPYLFGKWKHGVMAIIGRIYRRVLHQLKADYMRSGTSIPSSPIPFLMVLATLAAITRRVSFSASVLALSIL